MITRRDYLKLCAAAGVALAAGPARLLAAEESKLPLTRVIPRSGEKLPVVGLGSSASFARIAGEGERTRIGEILQALLQQGGSVFDTAPSYGEAEAVAGEVAQAAGLQHRLFWATKLNVAGRGGGRADPAAARAQLAQSLARAGKAPVDLVQVHNMADVPTQLAILEEARDAGRIRYVGATTTSAATYGDLESLLETGRIDFIGVDYAVDNRTMEERIFPLARDQGVAVLVYQPFGRTRLWQRVEGHALPDWAAELGIATWAQFFLKFAISHPAVTAATPATSQVRNLVDNLGAALGPLPDDGARRRMVAHIESLA